MSLRGKKIVVVGAGGDIGNVLCERLLELGAHVVPGMHQTCDVTSLQSIRSFFGMAWAQRPMSTLDGLVNCQGAPGVIKPTTDLLDEEFIRVLDTDLVGTLRTCREAAKYMLPQGWGRIVNVSSMHAIATYPQRAAYAAAKSGVCGLTRALAVEWAHRGLHVNSVLPGQVDWTRRTIKVDSDRMRERSPSGKPVKLDAVVDAVCFLLQSSGINGHSLVVDDGWTSSAWFGDHENP